MHNNQITTSKIKGRWLPISNTMENTRKFLPQIKSPTQSIEDVSGYQLLYKSTNIQSITIPLNPILKLKIKTSPNLNSIPFSHLIL